MRVRAFAKINLSLRVLGRRADGYHELRTIFQSIALHDTLTIRRRRGAFRLSCDDPACPVDDHNLVWRAADRMWRAAGRRGAVRDVSVDLTKRIPLQAGLGGGSSDAAAALRAFARLWRVDQSAVRGAAADLGADVPYFLEGGTVLGLERGDLLFPLIDYPPAWVVVAMPAFGVSTRDAFEWWERRAGGSRMSGGWVGSGFKGRAGAGGGDLLVNDLQAPVEARHPEIARLVRALRAGGAGAVAAAMSGSGSAVFGLFERRSDAARAAAGLAAAPRYKVSAVVVTKTLNRSKYQGLAGN
jgi:4-diphosphocytidyl-2-C-methyl-D-erythritol kinase